MAVSLHIVYESRSTLIAHKAPERSIPGIMIAAAAVVVMPVLAKAKRQVAAALSNRAMRADSKQADFCASLYPQIVHFSRHAIPARRDPLFGRIDATFAAGQFPLYCLSPERAGARESAFLRRGLDPLI